METIEFEGTVASQITETSFKLKVLRINGRDRLATDPENVMINHSEKYFPIQQGYVCRCQVEGPLKANNDVLCKEIVSYQALHRPFVSLGIDKTSIVQTLLQILGKSANARLVMNLYNALEKKRVDQDLESVAKLLSYWSEQWTNHGSESTLQLMMPPLNSSQQAITLLTKWRQQYDMRMLYLLGLSKKEIFECEMALTPLYEKICSNPYTVGAVSMDKARTIDLLTKRSPDARDFVCGTILRYVYDNSVKKGWMCTSEKALTRRFPTLLSLKDRLISEFGLAWSTVQKEKHGSVDDVTMVYLKVNLDAEVYVAEKLRDLLKMAPINKNIVDVEGTNLDPEQRVAVEMALTKNVSIITGSAGCGKTASIKHIQRCLDITKTANAATSFTGKAVTRIKELTGDQTVATMNRMICRPQAYQEFKHLIIDEASMVTVILLYRFFRTFRHNYAITFVGDITQLPPIGAGCLMSECMNSCTIPLTRLKTNHRVHMADGSANCIIQNAQRMARWASGVPYNFIEGDNFLVSETEAKEVIYEVMRMRDAGVTQDKFVIISPYNDGLDQLNTAVQLMYHRNDKFVIGTNGGEWYEGDITKLTQRKEEKRWFVGDRVMMLNNNYDIEVMNGTEGVILDVNTEELVVNFENKPVKIPLAKSGRAKKVYSEHVADEDGQADFDTRDIALAYAITVHKSQGSQWDTVIFYMKPSGSANNSGFLTRNLIYTAITRAESKVTMYGSKMTSSQAIGNSLPYRCECLDARLKALLPCLYIKEIDDVLKEEIEAQSKTQLVQYKDYELPPPEYDDFDYDDYE